MNRRSFLRATALAPVAGVAAVLLEKDYGYANGGTVTRFRLEVQPNLTPGETVLPRRSTPIQEFIAKLEAEGWGPDLDAARERLRQYRLAA